MKTRIQIAETKKFNKWKNSKECEIMRWRYKNCDRNDYTPTYNTQTYRYKSTTWFRKILLPRFTRHLGSKQQNIQAKISSKKNIRKNL